MRSLILLFNHTLTADQEEDARRSLGVTQIIVPPADIQELWSNVPAGLTSISVYLLPALNWLKETTITGDFVLIQGEFGATWLAVKEAFRLGLVPLYSTTQRAAVEEHLTGGKVEIRHLFAHVLFRRYE